ncbi:MAG TPA: Uma2 family endonuclease [Burkholderiaceae bacterium]|nr:Uma2 family endonuclease [Burkholderiaceae bacterium]
MGNLTSREALVLRWAEVINDPVLRDLPYKIELNAFGKIEMSPASTRHGRIQALIAAQLENQLKNGGTVTECAISTSEGIRVPDVIWASASFLEQHLDSSPLPQAPEICVDISSPSNADEEMEMKTRAYLQAGAKEVWIVSEDGEVAVFDHGGKRARSAYAVTLSLPPGPKG